MRVFKRKRGNIESKTWYAEFKDHLCVLHRLPLSTDKRASEEIARSIERLLAYRQAKRPLDGELLTFVEGMAASLREKLAEWDILDAKQAGFATPLMEIERIPSRNGKPAYAVIGGHLAGFKEHLAAKGTTRLHIVQSIGRCREVLSHCHFNTPGDIQSGPLNLFLSKLKADGKSLRTVNDHLIIFNTFCNWMVKTGVLAANPIVHLDHAKAQTDKRRVRRALLESEVTQLLSAAEKAPKHHGLTGHERALIYRIAMETGLRWNEIYTLQRRDFCLLERPCIHLNAANAKNRKQEELPIRQALAKDLAEYFAANLELPSAKAFAGMWKKRGADMLAPDLTAAGIEVETDAGVLDFHSLRHTFGSFLAKAGVPVKVAMDLMRHSDVNLTMNLYSHTLLEDRAKAISHLPPMQSNPESDEKTGTNDSDIPPEGAPKKGPEKGPFRGS